MADSYDGFIPYSHAADFLPLRGRWRLAVRRVVGGGLSGG